MTIKTTTTDQPAKKRKRRVDKGLTTSAPTDRADVIGHIRAGDMWPHPGPRPAPHIRQRPDTPKRPVRDRYAHALAYIKAFPLTSVRDLGVKLGLKSSKSAYGYWKAARAHLSGTCDSRTCIYRQQGNLHGILPDLAHGK